MANIIFIHFFLLGLLPSSVLFPLVYGQSQQGFISIDCGSNSSYTEKITGINYVPDWSYIETGRVRSIPSNRILSDLERPLWSLRSFPQGKRNCYNVKVKVGTKYLIRASFLYENYDAQNTVPEFDLHFGPNFWVTVKLGLPENIINKEIIHITTSNNVQVCLVNTGNGTPFISALELRPLETVSYETVSGSLSTYMRLDIGANNNTFIRYPDDVYDRIWSPAVPISGWVQIQTSSEVNNNDNKGFKAPSSVLNTASTVADTSEPMFISWGDPDQSTKFYIYMYFAELQTLQPNQSRTFKIYNNGKLFYSRDVSPAYLNENVIYSPAPLSINATHEFTLVMSQGSTLPPILNALEIYKVMNFDRPTTNQGDVVAIKSIKKDYKVTKEDWQGDPCAPKTLAWGALICKYDASNPPTIIGLNLSSSGLIGEISRNISNLAKLEVLDLSNNNLSGPVPNFLAEMPFLRVLNLAGNNLTGQVPAALINKMNKASLSLSLDGNPNLHVTATNEKKKNDILIPILAAVAGVIIILIILTSIYFIRRKTNRKGPVMVQPHSPQNCHIEPQSSPGPLDQQPRRRYLYADILKMTNHFDTLLGEGGFGKVYYGRISNDTEVAVKMLSPKSGQGYKEFQAEVDILLRVHHRNLTSLVGYCNEGDTKMGLIYEYMGRGNLGSLLLGGKGEVLRWKDRLQVALDSAQGLEYLHNGCRPPIIHRDIKSSNILLNEHFQAKLADFGLSRAFPTDGDATHITTKVVGTPGYLDPQYYISFRLTEKSDIYSFGIVLMELITGRPVLVKSSEISHITKWVDLNINQGDIYSIMDPKIKESCNVNSVWKAVDMAMACTASDPTNRPTMSQVVSELKECLNLELNHGNDRQVDSTMSIASTFDNELGPVAR